MEVQLGLGPYFVLFLAFTIEENMSVLECITDNMVS